MGPQPSHRMHVARDAILQVSTYLTTRKEEYVRMCAHAQKYAVTLMSAYAHLRTIFFVELTFYWYIMLFLCPRSIQTKDTEV